MLIRNAQCNSLVHEALKSPNKQQKKPHHQKTHPASQQTPLAGAESQEPEVKQMCNALVQMVVTSCGFCWDFSDVGTVFSGEWGLGEFLVFPPSLFPYHSECSFYARWTLFCLKEDRSESWIS